MITWAIEYTASATYEDDWVKVHFVAPRSRDQFEDRACPTGFREVSVESFSFAGREYSDDEIDDTIAKSLFHRRIINHTLSLLDPDNWTFDASEREW